MCPAVKWQGLLWCRLVKKSTQKFRITPTPTGKIVMAYNQCKRLYILRGHRPLNQKSKMQKCKILRCERTL